MKQYAVTGMSCAACAARIEKAVNAVKGVESCSVSLLTNSMGVEGTADDAEIIKAVRAAGYDARVKGKAAASASADGAEDALKDRETPALARRLAVSLCFLLPLMYVSMGHTMWSWPLPPFFEGNPVAVGLLQLLLTAAITVINQRFFVNGFKSLWHRAPNMDALVALGAAAAFGYSTFALFMMTASDDAMQLLHGMYFESAGTILTLITLGKMLEARSKGKTTDALKGLMKLAPKTATVIKDGEEFEVPISEVKAGDIFAVRPGERIPVDGVVTDGASAVDESTLTGESIPVDKAAGDSVSAGTANKSGFLKCRATRVGEDTTLSQIIRMVSDAAATKAPIAKTADRVSGVFVPAVIAVALVTTAAWLIAGRSAGYALARGISVLVISCPCALGLATPVAIMVGSGVGAKNGILFKTAASLEKLGKVHTAVLDKTGTVTEGKPKVTDVLPADGVSEGELIEAAFALEAKSEHPLAHAVTEEAKARGVKEAETEDFTALPGSGLTASLGGEVLLGGSLKFVGQRVNVPQGLVSLSEGLADEGKTPLFFAKGEKLLGIIAVADVIKEDSAAAIEELHGLGMRVVMLTGDNGKTARAIGQRAGVDEVIAGVLPDGKESAVRRFSGDGGVLMVGDGINDAPALTSADVGAAVGAGADVAIDAADVVLVKSRLSDVAAAVRLSRATLTNIRENLFWAFIYNTVGIPLAAGAFVKLLGWELNPMFGAAAMSLSSFCVVTNALRLNFIDIHAAKRDRKIKQIKTKERKNMKKTLKIEGMMCGHCEMHVKKALEALDGVTLAEASHTAGSAVVTLQKDVLDEALKAAVAEAGYTVTSIE